MAQLLRKKSIKRVLPSVVQKPVICTKSHLKKVYIALFVKKESKNQKKKNTSIDREEFYTIFFKNLLFVSLIPSMMA